jgi:hypothetical protein
MGDMSYANKNLVGNPQKELEDNIITDLTGKERSIRTENNAALNSILDLRFT